MKAVSLSVLLCAAIVVLMTTRGSAKPNDLYNKEFHAKNSHGESIDIAVNESCRNARTSTLTVKASEAALASTVGEPGFVLNCFYELAARRGAAYLIVLKEDVADDPRNSQFLIGFSPNPHVNPTTYFGLKEPLLKEKNEFISVKDHEALLKATR